jgi:hypothetical protein
MAFIKPTFLPMMSTVCRGARPRAALPKLYEITWTQGLTPAAGAGFPQKTTGNTRLFAKNPGFPGEF